MADAITNRRVLAIALPIVLSNATVPILGLVDTGVVGQLGRPEPIGAVGIGAVILTSIYWIFGFLRMGMTGMAAQALGQNDHAENSALLLRGIIIGVAAGLALILLQAPILALGLRLSPASEEVETLAASYMQIRIWSAPAAISVYALTGWLIAAERTRAVLLLQLWMNGVNIGLDLWFVSGLGWGVDGVARATFLAEWSAAGLGLWLCRGVFHTPDWRNWVRIFDAARLKQMAIVNTDILIRSVLLQAIFVSFMLFSGRFTDTQLAANQILLQFLYVTAYALDGFAFAAETLVGRAFGAGDRQRLRRAVIVSSLWSLAICLTLPVVFWVFGGWGIDHMTTAPDVQQEARRYLPYMIAAPLIGLASWMLDGIFIGATRTKDMRNMMILSAAGYTVALPLLLPGFGNHGLWLALLLSFLLRGITLGLRYPALERAAAQNAQPRP